MNSADISSRSLSSQNNPLAHQNAGHSISAIAQLQPIANEHHERSTGAGSLQAMADQHQSPATQLQALADSKTGATSPGGLPLQLKRGLEQLSGLDMNDVKVHRNSSKPAQLSAHAYAQGSNIHLGPGQDKHLAHEAWHVVQQKQGKVQPTTQSANGTMVNDSPALEKEADIMGAKAVQLKATCNAPLATCGTGMGGGVAQLRLYDAAENKVLDRPGETDAIKDAKEEAKRTHPTMRFTAHHKYPWNKIKTDIENAFVAPNTKESLKALDNLEAFAKVRLPKSRESFLKTVDHRKTTYGRNEGSLDTFIQEVCWVPGNIFIGPLSNNRIDDPSKRGGDDDFDGHYKHKRRMTLRSSQLREAFLDKGLAGKQVSIKENDVAPYDPSEWQEHSMGENEAYGETMYTQKEDPYYDSLGVIPYIINGINIGQNNVNTDKVEFTLKTSKTFFLREVSCSKRPGSDLANVVNHQAAFKKTNDNTSNTYKITMLLNSKDYCNSFKVTLLDAKTGIAKELNVNGLSIKRNPKPHNPPLPVN